MDRVDEFLQHHLEHAYDSAKRREYYLRTRELKGRKKGRGDRPTGGRPTGRPQPPRKKAGQTPAEIEARKVALEKKLERLKEVLRELVEAAKARSGVEPTRDKEASTPEPTSSKKDSKLTAAQKRKKAADARKDYEPEKQSAPTTKSLEADIAKVREQIASARAKLRASIERSRSPQAAVVRSTSDKQKKPKALGSSQLKRKE